MVKSSSVRIACYSQKRQLCLVAVHVEALVAMMDTAFLPNRTWGRSTLLRRKVGGLRWRLALLHVALAPLPLNVQPMPFHAQSCSWSDPKRSSFARTGFVSLWSAKCS